MKEDKGIEMRVGSLEELQGLFDQPVAAVIEVGEKRVEVECRRLRPEESARVNEIARRIVPPVVKGKDGVEEYQIGNPEYQEKYRKALRRQRALAIYLGCPMFRSSFAKATEGGSTDHGLRNTDQKENEETICQFVERYLTDEALDRIHQAITDPEASLGALVNFTSEDSPKS